MPRLGALLFSGKNGTGIARVFEKDAPTLPPEIDQKAQSLSVLRTSVPCAFFERPNYHGQALVITRGGGCNDLSSCVPSAGNWANRIRSIKFPPAGDPLLKEMGVELPDDPLELSAEGRREAVEGEDGAVAQGRQEESFVAVAPGAAGLLFQEPETGLPRLDFEGTFDSPDIPASVIVWITTEPRLPPIHVSWEWQPNGLEFLSATHTAWILYDDHGRHDRSKTIQLTINSLPVTFNFDPVVQGGTLVAQCFVHWRNPRTGQTGNSPPGEQTLSIRGRDPLPSEMRSLLPELPLEVIAYMESRFRQFNNAGLPLFGPPHGFGAMQLDTPPPTAQQIWDWRDNISGGISLFHQKKSQVAQHFQNIYKANPTATKLTAEQFNAALYQFYNGGFYWAWDAATKVWEKTGATAYGDEGIRIESLVREGRPPPDWGTVVDVAA